MTKSGSHAPLIAAILLILPMLYVGSYLLLVQPGQPLVWGNPPPPTYRVADAICSRLYWPLEQIDRKLRPKSWARWRSS